MGVEKIALNRVWIPYTLGKLQSIQTIDVGLATHWSIGSKQSGSNNHGVMTVGAAVLERSLRSSGRDLDNLPRVLDHAIDLYEIQRKEGFQGKEFHAGYNHFHLGAAMSSAIGSKLLLDRDIEPVRCQKLLTLCNSWLADRLAIINSARCPDGQVLVIGTRCWPHEGLDEKIWKSSIMAIAGQILDPLPLDTLTPWLKVLVPDSVSEPTAKHKQCAFGWHTPGTTNDAACLKLLHRAVATKAISLDKIRLASINRRPRVAGEVYSWIDSDGNRHMAAITLAGLPFRGWHSEWIKRSGLCVTITGEGYDDPDVRMGSGVQSAPSGVRIPNGIVPAFTNMSTVPPLVGDDQASVSVQHPSGWPKPGEHIPYRAGDLSGDIIMPDREIRYNYARPRDKGPS